MSDIVAVELNPHHPLHKQSLEMFGEMLRDGMLILCARKIERVTMDDFQDLEEKLRDHPDDIWVAFDRSSRKIRGLLLATVESEPDEDVPSLVVHAVADWNMWKDAAAMEKADEWCRPIYSELLTFARNAGCGAVLYRGTRSWAKHFPSCRVADNENQASDRIHWAH